jgi:hypothetical protein
MERPQPPQIYETDRLVIACEISGPTGGAPPQREAADAVARAITRFIGRTA